MHAFKQLLNLLFLVSLFAFVACRDSLDTSGHHEWLPGDTAQTLTFVYMIAENSLDSYATSDLNEMFSAATDIPDDCYMIAFVDDRRMPRVCRFYNDDGSAVCDTVYSFASDFCASDTTYMRTVFNMVLERYPAKEMNLVLWSHGSGWINEHKTLARQRSIGIDNGYNGFDNSSVKAIEIPELSSFISSLPVKPQLLMFDACFMQNVEVAYELRNCVDYILASPAEIPGDGAPYHKMVSAFFAHPLNVEEVMKSYYNEYKASANGGVILSVVDCKEMDALARSTAQYVPEYFSPFSENNYNTVFSYLPGGYFPYGRPFYPDFFDVNSAMRQFLSADDYAAWKMALETAVPYKCASSSWYSAPHRAEYAVDKDVYSGIAMYIPQNVSKYKLYNDDFSKTSWYAASGWGQAGW